MQNKPHPMPVTPGAQTSEFKLTAAAMALGALTTAATAGPLTLKTAALAELPIAAQIAAHLVPSIGGILSIVLPAIAYAKSRGGVKEAQIHAAAHAIAAGAGGEE